MKRQIGAAIGVVSVAFLLAVGASSVYADTIVTFSTSGSSSGYAVSGTAVFDIGASSMTITLTNSSNVASISQELDGLAFSLTGGTGLTLASVSAAGFLDCTSGTCTSVSSFYDYQDSTTLGSPYDWALSGTYDLFAGGGSYHPAAIVNSGLIGASTTNLKNGPHNDLLVGPVTFTFDFTSAPTGVSDVTFYWGTVPNTTGGEVPDGGITLMMLGGVLVGLETLRRRFRA